MPKQNPYNVDYVMSRDNCSLDEAKKTISELKEKNAWNKGKRGIKKSNPYDPSYVMKRDNCSFEEAQRTIQAFKDNKATSLDNFIKKYGEVEGLAKYEMWKEKSINIGHSVSRENGKSQSKFSPQYYVRHGYSEGDALRMSLEYQHTNSPLHIEYYLSRGLDLDYARKKIRAIHDKKVGIDALREKLINSTSMDSSEIDELIKKSRGNCSRERLGDEEFEKRMAKTRQAFESKGIWVPLSDLSDYELYKRSVWEYTNKNDLSSLPNFDKRGRAGVDGAYQLDHRFSISRGYIEGVSPMLIGSLANLEFIPWRDNLKKQGSCSIFKEDLEK